MILALPSLRVTKGLSVEEDQFSSDESGERYTWLWCISGLLMLVVVLTILTMMSEPENDDEDEHGDEDEESIELDVCYGTPDEPLIPPREVGTLNRPVVGYSDELLRYIAMAGQMFAVILIGTMMSQAVSR